MGSTGNLRNAGRPPLGDRREIPFRILSKDAEQIRRAARRSGETVARWIRNAAAGAFEGELPLVRLPRGRAVETMYGQIPGDLYRSITLRLQEVGVKHVATYLRLACLRRLSQRRNAHSPKTHLVEIPGDPPSLVAPSAVLFCEARDQEAVAVDLPRCRVATTANLEDLPGLLGGRRGDWVVLEAMGVRFGAASGLAHSDWPTSAPDPTAGLYRILFRKADVVALQHAGPGLACESKVVISHPVHDRTRYFFPTLPLADVREIITRPSPQKALVSEEEAR